MLSSSLIELKKTSKSGDNRVWENFLPDIISTQTPAKTPESLFHQCSLTILQYFIFIYFLIILNFLFLLKIGLQSY